MVKYDVLSDLCFLMTVKMTVIGNFIVISLVLNELSYRGHNLIQRKLKKIHSSEPNFLCYLPQKRKFSSDFCHFWTKQVLKIGLKLATSIPSDV